jgi:hypothetical protein
MNTDFLSPLSNFEEGQGVRKNNHVHPLIRQIRVQDSNHSQGEKICMKRANV